MTSTPEHLAHAAARAALRPGFVGYFISRYADIERLTEESLAAALGIEGRIPVELCLMLAPDARDPEFARHISEIANASGTSCVMLAQIVKRVQALDQLAAAKVWGIGSLAAARDRVDGDPSSK